MCTRCSLKVRCGMDDSGMGSPRAESVTVVEERRTTEHGRPSGGSAESSDLKSAYRWLERVRPCTRSGWYQWVVSPSQRANRAPSSNQSQRHTLVDCDFQRPSGRLSVRFGPVAEDQNAAQFCQSSREGSSFW